MIKKMDFISLMEGLVYFTIGIAMFCIGLSIYLLLPKHSSSREKTELRNEISKWIINFYIIIKPHKFTGETGAKFYLATFSGQADFTQSYDKIYDIETNIEKSVKCLNILSSIGICYL